MYTAKVTKQISRWPNSCLIKAFVLDLNFFPNSMQNINATQKSLPPIQFDYHIWKQIWFWEPSLFLNSSTYNAAKCNPVQATNKQSDFIHM